MRLWGILIVVWQILMGILVLYYYIIILLYYYITVLLYYYIIVPLYSSDGSWWMLMASDKILISRWDSEHSSWSRISARQLISMLWQWSHLWNCAVPALWSVSVVWAALSSVRSLFLQLLWWDGPPSCWGFARLIWPLVIWSRNLIILIIFRRARLTWRIHLFSGYGW